MDILGGKMIQVQITINAEILDDGDVLTEHGHLTQRAVNVIKTNLMNVVNSHYDGVTFDSLRVIKEEE